MLIQVSLSGMINSCETISFVANLFIIFIS